MDSSATHQRFLLAALANTTGPVLELGAGWYSTPVLHEVCKMQGRMLYTFDNNIEWIQPFLQMESPLHKIFHVEWWGDLPLPESRYGLVFVDHAPACRREDEIRRVHPIADVIVAHDWEEKTAYGYKRVSRFFEYCRVDNTHPAETAILSNTVDINQWLI